MTQLGQALLTNRLAQVGEILAVFLAAGVVIWGVRPLAGEDPVLGYAVLWAATMVMIGVVWLGLRLRGQGWEHLGLSFQVPSRRAVVRAVIQSIVVFVVTALAFVAGQAVMAGIVGSPESADVSAYDFLRNNLGAFLLSLASVYVISSFGEEVIYRGFLINRVAELGSGSKAAWWAAVVFSAVVFGSVHYAWGGAGIVQTALAGLALGASYLVVGRNLWVTILAHVYLDTALLLPIYLSAN